jgi:signal transduction histidine kinase
MLTDLGSSNGTFLNGQQINETAELHDGDIIMLGKASLTFRSEHSNETGDAFATEQSSGLRLVGDEESASVILSTKVSDRTPFTMTAVSQDAREHLDRLNQRLLALYRLSDVLRGASRREAITKALLDLIFEILPADRGAILRFNGDTDDLEPELFHFRDDTENREMVVSRTIMRRALDERIAVLSRDVRSDARLQASESIFASDIRSAMCVPLAGKRNLMGLLFLDTREAVHAFTEDDLAFVSALATDAAMTLENLMLVEENLRQERLAAVGQTIFGLAHNIKNILQLARGGTELMDQAISKQKLDDIAVLWPITRRSIERMQALTQEMLDFSRPADLKLERTDINEVVRHLGEIIQGEAEKKNVKLALELDPTCSMPMTDADTLTKALLNLLSNAMDALTGRDDAAVQLITGTRNGHAFIQVCDNGPGIPAEIQARVFQPFFSTKGSQGNGLGLSMTRKYIEDMGARLELHSAPNEGCKFTIMFPSDSDQP